MKHASNVSVTAVLVFLCAACGGPRSSVSAADQQQPARAPAVEVVQSREGVVPLSVRMTGTVRASGEVAIYPEVSGPVVEVHAQNGDAVKKGDPLVRIQAAGSRPQLTQARSSLDAARAGLNQAEAQYRELAAEYERNAALGRRGLVPQNTVDSLRAQVDAARAAVATARAQVDVARGGVAEQVEVRAQTVVRAPIGGRIGQRNVEVGMRVDTQTPLFVIGRLQNMRVEVPVTQEVVSRIKPGQRVELMPGDGADRIAAAVSRISPFLQQGSFSAEVEIDVPNHPGTLLPGMFVTVDIFHGESEPTTLVPVSAMFENPSNGERGVYVSPAPSAAVPAVDGGRPPPVGVEFRPVNVIAQSPESVGIKGLKPGEWVVVVGQHLLATEQQPTARVRAIEWDRIMEMQQLQREDLLRDFMERQQRAERKG